VFEIAFRRPPCRSGAVRVEGTFEETRRRVKASYSYERIIARNVTCLPDREQEPK